MINRGQLGHVGVVIALTRVSGLVMSYRAGVFVERYSMRWLKNFNPITKQIFAYLYFKADLALPLLTSSEHPR